MADCSVNAVPDLPSVATNGVKACCCPDSLKLSMFVVSLEIYHPTRLLYSRYHYRRCTSQYFKVNAVLILSIRYKRAARVAQILEIDHWRSVVSPVPFSIMFVVSLKCITAGVCCP
jgi:hypothetical protein